MMKPTETSKSIQIDRCIKQRCIGLTGGIATGKSTVAQILRELGYQVADADHFARAVSAPGSHGLASIVAHFGPTILNADQTLNRDRLREHVMANPEARKQLETITHPAIQDALRAWVSTHIDPLEEEPFFYEASLIFETQRDSAFRQVWSTICPKNTQINRLIARSGLTRDAADKLLAAQLPADVKAAKAHQVINTDCPLFELRQKIEDLTKTIRR